MQHLWKYVSLIVVVVIAVGCGAAPQQVRVAHLRFPRLTGASACAPPSRSAPRLAYAGRAMSPLCDDVYVESGTPPEKRAELRMAYTSAVKRVTGFYGGLHVERPRVVFCASDTCRVWFAGPTRRSWNLAPGRHAPGARYVSDGRYTVVMVHVDALSENALAHELSHLELQRRVAGGDVPIWFNEGVATYLGGEPVCTGVEARGIHDLRALSANEAWIAYTDRPGRLQPTYCQARDEVSAWIARYGKRPLLGLIDAVRRRERFDPLYGPMLTQ
jgi:hypothetical protein